MVTFACNPRIGKTETDKFLGLLKLSRISDMPSFVLFETESGYISWNGLELETFLTLVPKGNFRGMCVTMPCILNR